MSTDMHVKYDWGKTLTFCRLRFEIATDENMLQHGRWPLVQTAFDIQTSFCVTAHLCNFGNSYIASHSFCSDPCWLLHCNTFCEYMYTRNWLQSLNYLWKKPSKNPAIMHLIQPYEIQWPIVYPIQIKSNSYNLPFFIW